MTSRGLVRAVGRCVLGLLAALIPAPLMALETRLVAPGVPEPVQERLREGSSALTADQRGLDTPLELLSASLADYRTLVQILYDEGYFSPVVNIRIDGREAADINPLETPARIDRIEIAVRTGPPFRFGTARIGPLAAGTELPAEFAPGAAATTGAIRDAAIAAVEGWRTAGHAKADTGRQRIVARHAQARLDAEIEVIPGPKLTFGRLVITGDSDVRPDSIRRIAGFPTGEVYDPEKVQQVGTRLRRTGTFNSVTLSEAETPNADGTLDFDATLQDLPKRRLTLGFEISSRNGLDLTAIWLHRNLFKGAERFQFEARVRNIGGSEDIDGRIGLRLDRPDRLGPDDSIFYLAELERRDRTHYAITRGLLGIGARRTFSKDLYAEAAFGFSYGDADDAFGTGRKFRYLGLPLRTEWDRRDSKVSATSGFYLDAELAPFIGLSDSASGARAFVDGRTYLDIGGSGRLVLAGRMQLGSVVGARINEVSPDLLFFSGGAGSVRGQPFESLGIPVGNDVAGGRSYLALSAEIRGRVTEAISVVGFYDFGAVDSSALPTADSARHSGAGLGLRYDLGGFGPLRVDLAVPVSGSTGEGLQFYIGIGQAF